MIKVVLLIESMQKLEIWEKNHVKSLDQKLNIRKKIKKDKQLKIFFLYLIVFNLIINQFLYLIQKII